MMGRSFFVTRPRKIESRDYQQSALNAWCEHERLGSAVFPTGSRKTFLGLQAIADADITNTHGRFHNRPDKSMARYPTTQFWVDTNDLTCNHDNA